MICALDKFQYNLPLQHIGAVYYNFILPCLPNPWCNDLYAMCGGVHDYNHLSCNYDGSGRFFENESMSIVLTLP